MKAPFLFLIFFVAAAFTGCGASGSESDGGGGSAFNTATTGAEVGGGGAAGTTGSWTECSTPEGYTICGGDPLCPLVSTVCWDCVDPSWAKDGHVSICTNAAYSSFFSPLPCGDGSVLVQLTSRGFQCAPFNLGVLLANAGAPEQVRYADWGLWTGEPLPMPTSCPYIEGITLCGGYCGGCAVDEFCWGRSPRHPYGMCFKPQGGISCEPGNGYFIYEVEPEAQPLADEDGSCMPLDQCQAAAANLPGGGKCVLP